MGVWAEIKSGSFSIYAQYMAIISIILLIALGVQSLISSPSVIAFVILGWIFAAIMIFLECPLCIKVNFKPVLFFFLHLSREQVTNANAIIFLAERSPCVLNCSIEIQSAAL